MSLRIASYKVRLSEAQAAAYMFTLVAREFEKEGYDAFLTSGIDGVHSRGSLHTDDPERDDRPALDFRTKHVGGGEPDRHTMRRIFEAIKLYSSPLFDVLWEDIGEANEHLHIEYDPD